MSLDSNALGSWHLTRSVTVDVLLGLLRASYQDGQVY